MTGSSRPSAHNSLVAEYMAVDPIVIRADATLTEAADLMDRHHVHGLPVVDHAGALVGVLSQTDLNRARSTEYLWANWPGLAVRHLMTAPAITVHRSTPLVVAARKMERHHIHRLVVVDDGDDTIPIGVLSMTDLIHALAEETARPNPPQPKPEPAS
ncbi:MAG TPA: CBS domain-containing protein [Candidatus Deferrimicrobiaceae bacterium]|nr:CBS domain-containing protein [Candidatus Deferrimicrobiaceae bacterium]